MKCSEMLELMNRYLDHDLGEIEQKQLFQHLDGCNECAETFDTLRRISTKLENLPDVSPRYSLVDAILPKLDEIDQSRISEDVADMAPIKSNVTPLERDKLSSENGTQNSSKRRRYKVWPRITGGVAAAAAILLFCMYQFQPKTIPNAEPAPDIRSSQVTSTDPTVASSNLETKKQATGTTSPDTSASSDGAGSVANTSVPVMKNSTSAEPSLAPGDQSASPAQTPDHSPDPQLAPRAPNGQDTAPDRKVTENANPEAKKNTPSSRPSSSTVPITSTEPVAGILMTKVNEWTSSDSTFVAAYEQGDLNVYKLISGERVKVHGNPIKGTLDNGYWDEKKNVFHYTVTDNGKSVTMTLDADNAASNLQK